ncbi:probable protein phosphatase DDB_G0282105 [Procambarus clarkii]|uniref:probable protein phosphatase DDB_G0282105 n=1 Tax=Procambarus clarkii TaxID=6728 RepID=UPI0037438A4B
MKVQKVFTLEQGEVPEKREEINSQAPLKEFEITSGVVKKLLLELDPHQKKKTSVKEPVRKLSIGADELTTNDKVCEELNKKFQVLTVEQGEVPEIGEGRSNQTPQDEFVITREEVKKHLLELKVTKAIGPDGMSPWILKEGAEDLCQPLAVVYNTSLVTGELPKTWKTADVVPIFKKGDRQEALSYRLEIIKDMFKKYEDKVFELEEENGAFKSEFCTLKGSILQQVKKITALTDKVKIQEEQIKELLKENEANKKLGKDMQRETSLTTHIEEVNKELEKYKVEIKETNVQVVKEKETIRKVCLKVKTRNDQQEAEV